ALRKWSPFVGSSSCKEKRSLNLSRLERPICLKTRGKSWNKYAIYFSEPVSSGANGHCQAETPPPIINLLTLRVVYDCLLGTVLRLCCCLLDTLTKTTNQNKAHFPGNGYGQFQSPFAASFELQFHVGFYGLHVRCFAGFLGNFLFHCLKR